MAKITFGATVDKSVQAFKKGDLVLLREGQHHHEGYKRRPVIVTRDARIGDDKFTGFCLVDCHGDTSFHTASFEQATCAVSLSN